MKPMTCWLPIDPGGLQYIGLIKRTKKGATNALIDAFGLDAKYLRKAGYRIVKVEIREVSNNG